MTLFWRNNSKWTGPSVLANERKPIFPVLLSLKVVLRASWPRKIAQMPPMRLLKDAWHRRAMFWFPRIR